jgi:putative ABC transport system ATP-binding protein
MKEVEIVQTYSVLQVENLSKAVNQNGNVKHIIEDISYSFQKSKIYNILGPSGAGKSSLLRLLCRLDEPTEGIIKFNGDDYRNQRPNELRKKICYLFQTPYLFPGTVRDNFLYVNPDITDEKICELFGLAGLDCGMIDHDSENLSVGERQRVSIVRLLTLEPSVVLLDEPTSAIDPANKGLIEDLIGKLYIEKEITVIMVSHDPSQALRMSGETLLIVNGKLAEHGPSEQILNKPQTELGQLYKDMKLR